MKETSNDATIIYHQDDSDTIEDKPNVSGEIDQSNLPPTPPTSQPIRLTSKGAIQLTGPSTDSSSNATTNAILNLKINPFFQDKRKWDDSFTVAEKKELTGNIVKAARDNAGETYVTLQEEEFTVDKDAEDDSQVSDSNKKPGRKPMADEDSLSDHNQDPKVKRKAQNRAAQRAFRERKERYVKELEIKIKQVQDAHFNATAQLVRENQQLRDVIYRLESENYALKGISMQPYQSQAPPPVHQTAPPTACSHNKSNYAAIAPLSPQTHNQQPPSSPMYLPSCPSIHHSTSSLVNQMMLLASSPLQQNPMSSVVSAALQSTSLKPGIKTTSKKAHPKQNKVTPPPPPSPLEYTFSISTPASLRSNGGASTPTSFSLKHSKSGSVELVQLYPPRGNPRNSSNTESPLLLKKSDLIMLSHGHDANNIAKRAASVTSASSNGSHSNTAPPLTSATTVNSYQDDAGSVMSYKTSSTVSTQQQLKKIQQLQINMFDCHIATEGQLFCEKLHNEVCNDAFDRLLSEPLFDQMGKLNLSISNYPVPIVIGPTSFDQEQQKRKKETQNEKIRDENTQEEEKNANQANILSEDASSSPASTSTQQNEETQTRLLTCPEIWFILSQQDSFRNFTTDQLFQAVKELAKCADSGPVLEESALFEILVKMDQGYL